MDELTESARQTLVSQGIILGGLSIIISSSLFVIGLLVTTKNSDILHFIALYQLAILEIACGVCSLMIVLYVWWIAAGYRNRQLIVRTKYLDDKMSKGLIAMFLPILINFAALIVSAIFLMIKTETTSGFDIKSAMSSYSTDYARKVIVDKIQITLKCCGSQDVEDWYSIDWQNSEVTHPCRNKSKDGPDTVPFSCCCIEAAPPCIHSELKKYGTDSLYSNGCAEKLDDAIFTFVLLAVILFFISTFLMAVLMYVCRKLQTSARSAVCKGDATAPGIWWILNPSKPTAGAASDPDCLPLLGRTGCYSDTVKDENKTANCKSKTKNVVTSQTLLVQKQYPFKSFDEDSSDEWTGKDCEASNSSSTRTDLNSVSLVSDKAVANADTSHHSEHKPHPLIRS